MRERLQKVHNPSVKEETRVVGGGGGGEGGGTIITCKVKTRRTNARF